MRLKKCLCFFLLFLVIVVLAIWEYVFRVAIQGFGWLCCDIVKLVDSVLYKGFDKLSWLTRK
jgi:hypothetical protein